MVVADDWNTSKATLQRFERAGSKWRKVGDAIQVVVGRNGLGWGVGLHPADAMQAGEPEKKEGDGKAPAGVFKLLEATGYDAAAPKGATLKYRQADEQLRCVDDVNSPQYNLLVEEPNGKPSWSSAEHMKRDDDLYVRAIVVEHNRNPPKPGKGSCIFLHKWAAADHGTAGCTAMERDNLESLLAWLKASNEPLLIQLPKDVYKRLDSPWGLPAL